MTQARPAAAEAFELDTAHRLAASDLAARLDVRPETGLSVEQVRLRNEQHGPNRLPDAPVRSAWLVFAFQFKSILILILLGAAGLAALIGNVKDAVVILAVVLERFRLNQQRGKRNRGEKRLIKA